MVITDKSRVGISDFYRLIFQNEELQVDSSTLELVEKNYRFLEEFIENKIIYGINTGLGPMAQYKVDDDKHKELQLNLIRSHSSGCGDPIDKYSIKAAMISRLICFSRGLSGIHPEVIELIRQLINNNIIPYIPEHGGVGASGDLVQLAHFALSLIGEGKVLYKNTWQPTDDVLRKLDLKPIGIHIREGLALINGTAVMSGIGVINLIHARNLFNWMIIASAIINEIVETFDDHYSNELNSVKSHPGQNYIAKILRNILQDSKLTKRRPDVLYNNNNKKNHRIKKKVQEYYSIRCIPQILGPVYDVIVNAEKVLEDEINSVNDNPVIDMHNKCVFHGGNFHGDYVSLEMDKLKIALTKLSMLSERQLNFLMNHKINEILPPFVNLGVLGLNLGMQGAQFTATSNVAENQTLSTSMYVHSIPCNNENQDIVSMGTNAALITKRIIENAFQTLSIELIALIQAVDYLEFQDKLSEKTKWSYKELRKLVPKFNEDKVLYEDIENIKNYILKNKIEL